MSFSFGAPSSAPATTGLTGGFSFGANKPATPAFGLTATSQPSAGLFGTPATSAPAFGTSFGATAAPGFGASAPAFGTSAAAPAFGTATPAFGAASTAPTFGSTQASGGLTAAFGATTTTTPSFGLSTGGLGTGGLNFGAGTNTSTPSTGLSFGAPATTSAAPGLGGLGGFSFGAATTQTSGFGLGTATTTSSLFGTKLGTTSVTSALPSTSATPSLGLGGVAPSSGIGAANATTDAKAESPKQQKLPNEIASSVESFKEFVKKQKGLSSEVMRVTAKPLHTVSKLAESTLREALSLAGGVARHHAASRRQRAAAAAALAAAEAAARDLTHPGSELEGSAPPAYVKELISELEQQLIAFRRQMDIADRQMQAEPKLLTEQELNLGFRRMHESLIGLAARLQAVHAQVEAQKEQYLNLRKYILKDPTNVFDTPTHTSSLDQILKDVEGSRKKIKTSSLMDGQGSAVLSDPRAALGNINQLAGPTPFGYVGWLSPYPTSDNSAPTWQPQPSNPNTSLAQGFGASTSEASSFQLQRPPGKRGKQ